MWKVQTASAAANQHEEEEKAPAKRVLKTPLKSASDRLTTLQIGNDHWLQLDVGTGR